MSKTECMDKATRKGEEMTRWHAWSAGFMLAVVAALCSSVRADVVEARAGQPLVNTQILRLKAGRLVCQSAGGQEISFPIEQVKYLQITGWQMLNLAEKQRRADDRRRAAVSYERALADLQLDPPADRSTLPGSAELDHALLVKCRLIPVWDAQARFDRAVELYLEVIEVMPTVVDALQPRNFPETGTEVLEMAARQVDTAIARAGDGEISRSLRTWRETWPVRPTASLQQGTEARMMGLAADQRAREQVRSLAELVQARRYDEALAVVDQMHKQLPGGLRADLFYWQGRALEAMYTSQARTPALAETAEVSTTRPAGSTDVARAGIAYMRVVVHFPHHPLAAECLYRAGDLCRRSGQREQAAALWSELISAYPQAKSPDGELWADKAREELK
jgi:tetratricopeptide (TPR) repeat protein